MFTPSVPRREEEVDAVQTSIRSFGTIYQRDIFGLLPVDAGSNKLAVVNDPPKKPDRRTAAVGKRPVSTGIRGVRKWVAVTFVIGELKGDEGRTARDRAMLCDAVVEASSYVKVVLGYKDKGADWIEQRLKGVQNPDEGPLARRGADGKTKYIKLSPDEKMIAVQMHDQMIAEGWSSRETIKHLQLTIGRFRNVVASSITAWRKPEESNNGAQVKLGAPPVVTPDIRQAIKEKVCSFRYLLDLSISS
jgi:hypothetical protein